MKVKEYKIKEDNIKKLKLYLKKVEKCKNFQQHK